MRTSSYLQDDEPFNLCPCEIIEKTLPCMGTYLEHQLFFGSGDFNLCENSPDGVR